MFCVNFADNILPRIYNDTTFVSIPVQAMASNVHSRNFALPRVSKNISG